MTSSDGDLIRHLVRELRALAPERLTLLEWQMLEVRLRARFGGRRHYVRKSATRPLPSPASG